MTKLIVEELRTTLSQNFTNDRVRIIKHIRPWLYKHLSPSGDLNIVVKQGGQTLATSETVTSSYIETNTDSTALNYTHGFFRFTFTDAFVLRSGDFTIELQASGGYSFSESAYFGWVKPHENKLFTTSYSPSDGANQTFGVEIWEYRDKL